MIRDQIDFRFHRGIVEIERGGNALMLQGGEAGQGFDGGGRAEQMAGDAFGRADGHVGDVGTKD